MNKSFLELIPRANKIREEIIKGSDYDEYMKTLIERQNKKINEAKERGQFEALFVLNLRDRHSKDLRNLYVNRGYDIDSNNIPGTELEKHELKISW